MHTVTDSRRMGSRRDRAAARSRARYSAGVGRGRRARHGAPAPRSSARRPTLEGYLFPDTYSFPDGTTARAAMRRDGARVRARVEARVGRRTRQALGMTPQRRRDAGIDHREGSAPARGAAGDLRGLSQPAAARDAAAGRSDDPVRARPSRRARHVQGPRGRVAVQHLPAPGTSARADRKPGRGQPGRGGRRRRMCRTCISSRRRTAITSSARRSRSTPRRGRSCATRRRTDPPPRPPS